MFTIIFLHYGPSAENTHKHNKKKLYKHYAQIKSALHFDSKIKIS